MKFSKKTLFIALFFMCLYACKNHKYSEKITNRSPYFSAIVGDNDENVFRNVNYQLTPEQIKKIETSKLYENAPDHLFYEITFPDDSSKFQEYADLEYYFNDQNKLDIVVAKVYVNDSLQQDQLLSNLRQYYTEKLGNSSLDNYNYETWQGIEPKNKSKYSVGIQTLPKEFGLILEYKEQNTSN